MIFTEDSKQFPLATIEFGINRLFFETKAQISATNKHNSGRANQPAPTVRKDLKKIDPPIRIRVYFFQEMYYMVTSALIIHI